MTRSTFFIFSLSCIFIAIFTFRIFIWPVNLAMAHMAHYLPDLSLPFWGHILFGPIALLVLPVQFSDKIRKNKPRLHRISGYIYIGSIFIAAPSAFFLLPKFLGNNIALAGFAILSIIWPVFTLIALRNAIAGNFHLHQHWMARSAALTFAAVTLRIMMFPMIAAGMTVQETYMITAWASWIVPLIWVEWRFRSQQQLLA